MVKVEESETALLGGRIFELGFGPIRDFAFSPEPPFAVLLATDDMIIALTGAAAHQRQTWRAPDANLRRVTWIGHQAVGWGTGGGPVMSYLFRPDGGVTRNELRDDVDVAVTTDGLVLAPRDRTARGPLQLLYPEPKIITPLKVTVNSYRPGTLVATGNVIGYADSGAIVIWDRDRAQPSVIHVDQLPGFEPMISALAISPGAGAVASCVPVSGFARLVLWSLEPFSETPLRLSTFMHHDINAIEWAPDGKHIVAFDVGHAVHVHDAANLVVHFSTSSVCPPHFHPCGALFTCDGSELVRHDVARDGRRGNTAPRERDRPPAQPAYPEQPRGPQVPEPRVADQRSPSPTRRCLRKIWVLLINHARDLPSLATHLGPSIDENDLCVVLQTQPAPRPIGIYKFVRASLTDQRLQRIIALPNVDEITEVACDELRRFSQLPSPTEARQAGLDGRLLLLLYVVYRRHVDVLKQIFEAFEEFDYSESSDVQRPLWIYLTESKSPVLEIIRYPEIEQNDLVVALSSDTYLPLGIHRATSKRIATTEHATRCTRVLEFPGLSARELDEVRTELLVLSQSTHRNARDGKLHGVLLGVLLRLYASIPRLIIRILNLLDAVLPISESKGIPSPHNTELAAKPPVAPVPLALAPTATASPVNHATVAAPIASAGVGDALVSIVAPADTLDSVFWLHVSATRVKTRWKGEPSGAGVIVGALAEVLHARDPGAALYREVIDAKANLDDAGHPTPPAAALSAVRDDARRILLELDSHDLHGLPWEAITGALGTFGLEDKLPIARHIKGTPREPATLPLQIAYAIANPRGLGDPGNVLAHGLRPIDREAERVRFETAIRPFTSTGAMPSYAPATRAGLTATIAHGAHVLHIVAHGLWNSSKGDYGLVLEADDGGLDICYLGERGDPNSLLTILGTGRELRLVVLASCWSGAFGAVGHHLKPSLGARLAEVVPCVIAMQDEITPEAVGQFACGFYAGLATTGEADRAAALGRLMMRATLPATDRQWIVPAAFVATTAPKVFEPDAATREAAAACERALIPPPRPIDDTIAAAARRAGASMASGDAIAAAVRAAVGSAAVTTGSGATAGAVLVTSTPTEAAHTLRQSRSAVSAAITGPVALEIAPVLQQIGPAGRDLVLPTAVASQTVAALNSGKHVIFIGPPGTGKTTLTTLLTELAAGARFSAGTIHATASADWSTAETVGALVPMQRGVTFRAGLVLQAILDGRWLAIDEINRAEVDKAFGELFTILSNQPITIPFGTDTGVRVLPPHRDWRDRERLRVGGDPWRAGLWCPPDTRDDDIVVHPNFRILATMNVYDRSFLFAMSLAFMRRFAFIDVDLPDNYLELIDRWLAPAPRGLISLADEPRRRLAGKLHALVEPGVTDACGQLQRHRALGPAILADVIRYLAHRPHGAADWDAALGEAVALHVVPQLDGLAPEVVQVIDEELGKLLPQPRARTSRPLVSARLRALYPHVEFA